MLEVEVVCGASPHAGTANRTINYLYEAGQGTMTTRRVSSASARDEVTAMRTGRHYRSPPTDVKFAETSSPRTCAVTPAFTDK